MAYLADTNVAARRILATDPQYHGVRNAIDRLRAQGEVLSLLDSARVLGGQMTG